MKAGSPRRRYSPSVLHSPDVPYLEFLLLPVSASLRTFARAAVFQARDSSCHTHSTVQPCGTPAGRPPPLPLRLANQD